MAESLPGRKVKVAQYCPTLCNPKDYTVHGILQARILEWVAVPFSRGSSQPRDQTQVSHTAGAYQLSHQGSPWILGWVAFLFSSRSSWPRNWAGVPGIAGGFFTSWAAREKSSFSPSSWALLWLQDVRAAPAWLPALFNWSFCSLLLLFFAISPFRSRLFSENITHQESGFLVS